MDTKKNAAGREVITRINGEEHVPFKGVGNHRPEGTKHAPKIASCADYPADGNKVVKDLRTALEKAGLRDGMTISTHHHFRNGDFLANRIFDIAHEMGVKGLRWFPSASFPCHEHLIQYLEDGTIQRIEGSMNGPLGTLRIRRRHAGLRRAAFTRRALPERAGWGGEDRHCRDRCPHRR